MVFTSNLFLLYIILSVPCFNSSFFKSPPTRSTLISSIRTRVCLLSLWVLLNVCCICTHTENPPSDAWHYWHTYSHTDNSSDWPQRNDYCCCCFCICACASINILSRSSHTNPDTSSPAANHQGNRCHPKPFPWQPHPRGFGCLSRSLWKNIRRSLIGWSTGVITYKDWCDWTFVNWVPQITPNPHLLYTPPPSTPPSTAPSTPSPFYPQLPQFHLCLLYPSSLNKSSLTKKRWKWLQSNDFWPHTCLNHVCIGVDMWSEFQLNE